MKSLALASLLTLSQSSHALAPPPINFSEVRFEDDGTEYVITFDGKEMKIVAAEDTKDKSHNRILWGSLGCFLFLASSCGMSGLIGWLVGFLMGAW